MFTLVFINNQFNRPEMLLPFLQSNIGNTPLLQIDCITPYYGDELALISDVCSYLDSIDTSIKVTYNLTKNSSKEVREKEMVIHFIVIQISVEQR